MGSINHRSGLLFFDFRYKGKRCREYTKLQNTPVNLKRTKTILERIEAEIVLGSFDYEQYFPNSKLAIHFKEYDKKLNAANANTPLFKDFTSTWYRENEVRWKHSYKETLKISLSKHILPVFGDLPVSVIKKAEVLDFRASLANLVRPSGDIGLSPARVNHIMTPLRMILNEAADRYEFDSPVKNIKPLKVPKTQVDPFTLDEVYLILKNIRPDYKDYVLVRFFTGLRSGEMHGLKWKYIDFNLKQILVRESYVMGRMTDTKNASSVRTVHMSEPVYEALQRQQAISGAETFVFSNMEGNPMSNKNFTNRVWYPLLRYLDLPKRRPYQTRHTTATLWLASGESPEWIARQMGHSSTEMLFTVYSRYVPNLTRQDGSAFAALLSQQMNK